MWMKREREKKNSPSQLPRGKHRAHLMGKRGKRLFYKVEGYLQGIMKLPGASNSRKPLLCLGLKE